MTKILVLNVLDRQYYEDCRIKGSVSVPLAQLKEFVVPLPKHAELVVYCAHESCPLSAEAWKMLDGLGFVNARAYEGGMRDWLQKGFPVEGVCEKDYLHGSIESSKKKESVKSITAEELYEKMGY